MLPASTAQAASNRTLHFPAGSQFEADNPPQSCLCRRFKPGLEIRTEIVDTEVVASAEPTAVSTHKETTSRILSLVGKRAIQEQVDQQEDAVVTRLDSFKTTTSDSLPRTSGASIADACVQHQVVSLLDGPVIGEEQTAHARLLLHGLAEGLKQGSGSLYFTQNGRIRRTGHSSVQN